MHWNEIKEEFREAAIREFGPGHDDWIRAYMVGAMAAEIAALRQQLAQLRESMVQA